MVDDFREDVVGSGTANTVGPPNRGQSRGSWEQMGRKDSSDRMVEERVGCNMSHRVAANVTCAIRYDLSWASGAARLDLVSLELLY